MTDRELLEMAAKAAGYEIVGIAHKCIVQGVDEDDLLVANDRGGDSVWNPLTDDGDALRVAVKLGISFQHEKDRGVIWCDHQVTPNTTDPYTATRRAIVRAAAEIGKTMKD